jgi:hypothetical protein
MLYSPDTEKVSLNNPTNVHFLEEWKLWDYGYLLHFTGSLLLITSPLRLTTSSFIFQPNICDFSPYVTSSLTRGWFVVYNCCWPSPAQALLGSCVRVPRDSYHSLPSQTRNFPNLEGRVPVFIFHWYRVVQLHPQALGALFVSSCISHGYGGGIRTRLHGGTIIIFIIFSWGEPESTWYYGHCLGY